MCAKPLFVNGRLDEDQDFYAVNEMVKFICDDGFTLVGAKKLTCLKSGDFSGNIPICVRESLATLFATYLCISTYNRLWYTSPNETYEKRKRISLFEYCFTLILIYVHVSTLNSQISIIVINCQVSTELQCS